MVCGAVIQGGTTCNHTAQKLQRMWGWRAQSQMAAEWRWSPSFPHPVGGPDLPTWARGSQQCASAGPGLPACPELLARWCWSHSAQAVVHGACWHTTGSCSCSYCGIYCILRQLHKGSCDLLGSLQHSLLLSVVCRQSRIVFHVPHTQLTAFDSCPALSSQAVFLKRCQL